MARRHFSAVIEYDGAPHCGWQRQPGQVSTIQGELEEACSRILDQPVTVRGSGRTDAGVHALGQWATFSADTERSREETHRGLNALLPPSIRVRALDESPTPVDALRDTVRKTYFYQFHVGAYVPPHRRRTFSPGGRFLDVPKVRAAAQALEGEHDFTSFASEAARQRTCVRHLQRTRVQPLPSGVRLFFTATGFLYNMVRAMAAALRNVGHGRWSLHDLLDVLEARDRSRGPSTAPPEGLFLFRVDWGPSVAKSLQRRSSTRWPLLDGKGVTLGEI